MKDGRSKAPPPPDFLIDEMTLAAINHRLGTAYSLEALDDAPQMWIDKMIIWANAQHTKDNG